LRETYTNQIGAHKLKFQFIGRLMENQFITNYFSIENPLDSWFTIRACWLFSSPPPFKGTFDVIYCTYLSNDFLSIYF